MAAVTVPSPSAAAADGHFVWRAADLIATERYWRRWFSQEFGADYTNNCLRYLRALYRIARKIKIW